jgi:hypothetical protein
MFSANSLPRRSGLSLALRSPISSHALPELACTSILGFVELCYVPTSKPVSRDEFAKKAMDAQKLMIKRVQKKADSEIVGSPRKRLQIPIRDGTSPPAVFYPISIPMSPSDCLSFEGPK